MHEGGPFVLPHQRRRFHGTLTKAGPPPEMPHAHGRKNRSFDAPSKRSITLIIYVHIRAIGCVSSYPGPWHHRTKRRDTHNQGHFETAHVFRAWTLKLIRGAAEQVDISGRGRGEEDRGDGRRYCTSGPTRKEGLWSAATWVILLCSC